MTVDRIIPCVCCEHPPSVDDCSSYGMPILMPSNSFKEHKQLWIAKCPECGRGGVIQYDSAYLALKHWNEMQRSLYAYEGKTLLYTEDFKDTCSRLGYDPPPDWEQLTLYDDGSIELGGNDGD